MNFPIETSLMFLTSGNLVLAIGLIISVFKIMTNHKRITYLDKRLQSVENKIHRI